MKKLMLSLITIVLVSSIVLFVSCKKESKTNPPLISSVTTVGEGEGPFTINAKIIDDNGIESVKLFYKKITEDNFNEVVMALGTTQDTYSGEIPSQHAGDTIKWYIKATNKDNLISYHPRNAPTETIELVVGGINYSVLVLNEIWAGGPTDEHKFIELYNKSGNDLNISGVYFERNDEGNVGTIPEGTTLRAGAYYILGTKNNTTNPNDPNAPYDHSISKGFSAKKSVRLIMFSPSGNEIDRFLRGSEENLDKNISDLAPKSYCRIPNGTGAWKAVDNATLRAANDETGAIDIPND